MSAEHSDILLPPYVERVLERLERAGHEVYLVGGSLRDSLLGLDPHDFDLATSARPEQTAALFSDSRVIETGMKHGTVTVLSDRNPIEITTFRIDGSYTDARHPDSVTFTDRITDDLSRRDFTVNAMAYNPRLGLVDPFGGRTDLAAKRLRAVGEPCQRFGEDALRILRAFRFAAQLNFSIEEQTLAGVAVCREGLAQIARERIAAELLRLVLSDSPAPALRQMRDGGILPYVLGDYAPEELILNRLSDMPRVDVARLGFLLSDTDREHAARLLRSLKYSNKQVTGAGAVVDGSKLCVTSPAEARRMIASCGIYAPFAVHASVLRGNSPAEAIAWVEQNSAACTLSDLALSGRDLLAAGFEGKQVGRMLELLLSEVLEHPELNEKERLLTLALEKKKR